MPCYVINRRFIKFDFGFLVLNIKILKFFGPEFSKKFQMNPDEAPYVINVKKGRNIPESKLSFQKKLVEGKIDAKIARSFIVSWTRHELKSEELKLASEVKLSLPVGFFIYLPQWRVPNDKGEYRTALIPFEIVHHFFDPRVVEKYVHKPLKTIPVDSKGVPLFDVRLLYRTESPFLKKSARPISSKPPKSLLLKQINAEKEGEFTEVVEYDAQTSTFKPYTGKFLETINKRTHFKKDANARFPIDNDMKKYRKFFVNSFGNGNISNGKERDSHKEREKEKEEKKKKQRSEPGNSTVIANESSELMCASEPERVHIHAQVSNYDMTMDDCKWQSVDHGSEKEKEKEKEKEIEYEYEYEHENMFLPMNTHENETTKEKELKIDTKKQKLENIPDFDMKMRWIEENRSHIEFVALPNDRGLLILRNPQN